MGSGFNFKLTVTLLPAIVFLGLAVVYLRRGFRRGRVGKTPHCGKCDYNLTGLTSERCPECGANLIAGNIVYGEPYQKVNQIVLGLALLVCALIMLSGLACNVNWYQFRPAGWLMTDVSSGSAGDAQRAWNELTRRDKAGKLSASNRGRLFDVCLQGQAAPAIGLLTPSMIDYLGQACLRGQFSAAQKDRFVKQALVFALRVRPKIPMGQPIPFETNTWAREPCTPFWIRENSMDISLDGGPSRNQGPGGVMSGCGAGGGTSSHVPADGITAGRHKLRAVSHASLWTGHFNDESHSSLVGKLDVVQEAEFETLPAGQAQEIKHTHNPQLDASIRSCFEPQNLNLKGRGFEMRLAIHSPFVGVAMNTFVRVSGREHKIGGIHKAAGETTDWNLSETLPEAVLPMGGTFTSCDIILRSSDELARDTVDLFEIWEGELVYKDVPVKVEIPATQATASGASK